MNNILKIIGVLIVIIIVLGVGVLVLKEQGKQIEEYCTLHPDSILTGEMTVNCSDVVKGGGGS